MIFPAMMTWSANARNLLGMNPRLYLRTSRLDLDDYNHEADEGLHITSMAGTWMSIVEGMAGVRITEKGLSVQPHIPKVWKKYAFQILFKQSPIFIEVNQESCNITNNGINNVDFTINNILCSLNAGETSSFKLN